MGLDYSIRTFVKEEKIANCLNWLYNNSYQFDSTPFCISFNKENISLNANHVRINDHLSSSIEKNRIIKEFDKIYFSTSLIFDIDPKIIASLPGWEIDYYMDKLEDFKDDFENLYLGNGKIRIGGFDSTISKLKSNKIYEIEFTAVTSDMSRMLETSISVKKWMLELSEISNSILTLLDLEHNGHRIVYYKGKELNITIKDGFEEGEENKLNDLIEEYFKLTYEK